MVRGWSRLVLKCFPLGKHKISRITEETGQVRSTVLLVVGIIELVIDVSMSASVVLKPWSL